MDIKSYTDLQYIPISDLKTLGDILISKVKDYRRQFTEMVSIDDIEYASIVETPRLIKRRFFNNVELKNKIDIKDENNDFVLALAKIIIKNKKYSGIDQKRINNLIQKFKDNEKDLTIVTSWIIKNVDHFIKSKVNEKKFPQLNPKDMEFIKRCNSINEYYSISDYNSLNQTSYETGRRALEKLDKIGLYEKTKVGNKFVYKPAKKIIQMIGRNK